MKLCLLTLLSSLLLLGSTGRRFEENRGQAGTAGADVQFLSRDRGRQVFFTSRAVLWVPADGPAIRLRFPGATGPAQWQASGVPIGQISYAIGSDRSKWVNHARQFDRIIWRGAYPGIDIVFYWRNDRLEYDFLVAPGADPARIRIAWSGAPARLAPDGSIAVAGGLIQQLAPVAYQGTRKIPGFFLASGQQFRLHLGPYDRTRPLTIDPVLELSTYLGGENDDAVTTINADLIAGTTASIRFPGAAPDRRRSRDIFVRGLGFRLPGGLPYVSTFVFGGNGDDELGGALWLASRRSLIIGGTTRSTDFPTTASENNTLAGESDGFLTEFLLINGLDGTSVISSRLVGGSGADRISAVVGESFWYAFAGETNSPDLPNATNAHSGGIDGFYGHSQYPNRIHYLGGKEDDRILAMNFRAINNITLAGETRSPDFPHRVPDAPALQGDSDAFLATAIFLAPNSLPSGSDDSTDVRVSSWLLGGSREDRITALAPRLANLSIAFTGVTTSPDLPVRNAAQPELAGESDAFAGIAEPGGAIQWLSYLGGSGEDEATGIARNSVGDLFLTGWTRSTDLKTVSAFQEQSGGGEDAFYAIIGPGAIRTLTYFGGAGDDRAAALWLVKDGVARLGGWTRSTNLPLKNEWQDGRGQGTEGFLADIGSSYLYSVNQVALAKDGAIVIPARVPQSAVGQQITYRSSDPSKVRLNTGFSVGEEVTAPSITNVFAEALADTGEVDITISSPGFTPTVCRVKLYPGALRTYLAATAVLIWSGPIGISSSWVPLHPETGQPIENSPGTPISFTTRSGFRLPPLTWTSTNERVIQIRRTPGYSGSHAEAIAGSPGEAVIQTQASGLPVWPEGGVPVKVSGFTATVDSVTALGKDLQTALPFDLKATAFSQHPLRGRLTARSEDPSRLLVSLDPRLPGAGSVSGPLFTESAQTQSIWIQALTDEGEVRVFLSSPDFEQTAVTVVKLGKTRLRWGQFVFSGQQTAPVARPRVGESVAMNLRFETDSGNGFFQRRPGAPASLWRLGNSDSSIVEVNRVTIQAGSDALSLRGLTPGSATLTLSPVGPSEIELLNSTVGVEVTPVLERVFVPPPSRVALGKDLQTRVIFRYTGPRGAVSAISEDPSAVLLSPQVSQPGQPSLSLTEFSSNSEYGFQLQGLRDSGESTVLIRYPNGQFRLRVTAAPAGIGLRPVSAAPGFDESYFAEAYWLDGPMGIPVAAQLPRPGKRFALAIRTSKPELRVSPSTASLDFDSTSARINVMLPPLGEEAELLVESDGRTLRQPLRRPAPPAPVSISSALMRDTVTVVPINLPPVFGVRRIRATSRQPEAVSLSLSHNEPGTASVESTWSRETTFRLYLHGLKDTGTVTVLVEGDGIAPTEVTTILLPLRLQWVWGGFFARDSLTLSPGESLTGFLSLGDTFSFRPGAERQIVRLRSTAANIADVSPAAIEIHPGGQTGDVTLQSKEPGQADLLLEMEGRGSIAAPLTVNVAARETAPPSLLTLGANTQIPLPISLQRNPGGAIVTFRSSDPERVILSRSSAVLGSGSVSLAIPAGHLTGTVQVQALAAQGQVTITASSPGLPEQQWRVQLTPSWLIPSLSGNPSLAVGDRSELSARIEPADPRGAILLRPGLGDLSLEVVSSAPGIVRLASPSFRLAESGGNSVRLDAISPGVTTLRFVQPPGFGPAPEGAGELTLRVAAPRLSLACVSDDIPVLGKDTQSTCQFSQAPEGTVIEAVSSNPSLLLLSTDPRTPGAARQSIRVSAQAQLTLQALGGNGTAEVTLSAPGFEDFRLPVVLRRTEVGVNAQNITLSRGTTFTVSLNLQVPGTFGFRSATARAGATIQVQANFNPPGIVSAQPSTVTIAPNTQQGVLTLRGDAAGATLLQLTSPGGFVNPASPPIAILVQ